MRAGAIRQNIRLAKHLRWSSITPSYTYNIRPNMATLADAQRPAITNVAAGSVGSHKAMSSSTTSQAKDSSNCTTAKEASSQNPTQWRNMLNISIARSRKVRGGNYVQLATCTHEGHPRVRTIVQRGIMQHGGHNTVLKFITDCRSQKVSQLKARPEAELCWWFLKSSEQYRIRGKLTVVGDIEESPDAAPELIAARKQQWGNLRDSAREQFYWTHPGLPLDQVPEGMMDGPKCSNKLDIPSGGRGSDGKVLPPPKTFLLLLLWPEHVDYLRLTDNCRMDFRRLPGNDDIWQGEEVTP